MKTHIIPALKVMTKETGGHFSLNLMTKLLVNSRFIFLNLHQDSASKKCKCKSKFNVKHRDPVLARSPEPEAHDKVLDNSRSNWNLEMLVFEERGKPEDP